MDAVRAQAALNGEARAARIERNIIAILEKQGLRTSDEINERLPTPDASEALRRQLARLLTVEKRYKREAVKEKRKHARGIIKTLDRLQHQIETAPEIMKRGLSHVDFGFVFEPDSVSLTPSAPRCELGSLYSSAPGSSIEVKRVLTELRRQCEAQLSHLPQSDRLKLECARAAHYLISCYTKGKPTSTENSPFRRITGLLYTRITGTAGGDLKFACEKLLREERTPLARKYALS